jgi:vitamin B12 transporter
MRGLHPLVVKSHCFGNKVGRLNRLPPSARIPANKARLCLHGGTFASVSGEAGTGVLVRFFFPMTICIFALRRTVAACALACASFSYAQTELPTIVVTASRAPQQLADAIAHTTVLTARDIANSQAQDLQSLLAREAGIQINQNGGRGAASSIFMRGAASSQVLVLLDGVPLTKQDTSGAVSLEHVPLDQIDRIEIVRGNVSAVYGTGAIGGVVQLFSKSGAGRPRMQLTMELGTRGSSKLSASAQTSFGVDAATKIAVGLGQNKTDGFSAINTAQLAAANADKDGYKNTNSSFSLSHDLSKGHTLGLRLVQATGEFDYDSGFATPADLQTGRTKLQTTSLYSHHQFTQAWSSKLSYSESQDNNKTIDTGLVGRYRSNNRIVNWSNQVALSKDWQLSAGLEQQRQAASVDDGYGGIYDRSRQVSAVFAGVQGKFGAHALQLNLRHDKVPADRQSTHYLGYAYQFTPEWKLSASDSSAFNTAPLGYLYAPFFGNPSLKSEKAGSRELGLQWSRGREVLRATYFSTRSKNLFEYDFTSSIFQNVAKTKNSGLEISYTGQLAGMDTRASLTSQDPRDEVTGKLLNRRARTLASLGVSQPVGAWRWGADMRYGSARLDGTQSLASHLVTDLSLRYSISPELTAYGRIENLSDKRYQTVYGYNQAPRGVFVGLNWLPM